MRTDTELLDALEQLTDAGVCPGVVYDDNGHWAVSDAGIQTMPLGDTPQDISTSFHVEAARWRPTLREAINSYLDDIELETDDDKTS